MNAANQDAAARNPTGRGPAMVRKPDFEVSVNGRPPSDWYNARSDEHSKSFTIAPGESLAISVRMTFPAPDRGLRSRVLRLRSWRLSARS